MAKRESEICMEELLTWVDENDDVIGCGEKLRTHELGQLHRAFSLFIYNRYDQKMLIHRRADGKYHSGGLWTNACCSHPRKGEELRKAVIRRMREELGIGLADSGYGNEAEFINGLTEVGKFRYYHNYGRYSEYEIDHVFYLPIRKKKVELMFDRDEISEVKWISVADLKDWAAISPADFTAWFHTAFDMICKKIQEDEGLDLRKEQ